MHLGIFALLVGFLFIQTIQHVDAFAVMSVDLGSEWMKIAIVKPGVPMEIVLNKESKRKTEVAVSMRNDERVFGSSAKSKGVRFPQSTYFYLQDLLGKSIDNPLVEQYQQRFPFYKIEADEETGGIYFVHDEEKSIHYSPEELMAMILNHSKSLAEEYAQTNVDTCVITVPSFYTQAERKALLYAAKLAGLEVSQLMDVNAAAGLNYGVFRRGDINAEAQYLMLYDMGSTSTVASVITYQTAKVNGISDPQLSVKGVGFDRSLGGLEMELRLRDHLVKLFNEKKKTKSDVRSSPRAMAKLLKEANRVKKVLSANQDHMAQIEGLIDDEDFRAKVTREDFEEICSDLWDRVEKPMNDALEAAEMTMDMISQIIIIGGGTRVPKVQEMLLKTSGKSDLGRNLNADEAPALGASYQAAALSNAFKVKTFHVKSGAAYPIDINFQRDNVQDDGSVTRKNVKRTLFQRGNPYPQRKVITFNRFSDNFDFSVNYGDLSFLDEVGKKTIGSFNISDVELDGVKTAHEKWAHQENTESKGVKAHFRMDESGVLNLESVESVFEGNRTENVTVKIEDSTFQKIKDSLTNMFGGGSEPTKDDKKDDADQKDKDEKADSDEEKKEEKVNDDEKTEEKKEEEKTKVESKIVKFKQSEPITTTITALDHKQPSQDKEELSNKKLQELAEIDAFKLAREVALNKLETYIYEKKDRLYTEEYEEAMTDEEREKITEALNDASDWMDELEGEPAAQVYDDKRKELKEITRSWLLRVKQRKDVQPMLVDLEGMFNYTLHFIQAIKSLKEEDQIYTEVEIKTLTETLESTVDWKNATVKEESELKPFQDPVLKPADLKVKMAALNREVQYLINKAKTAKPKSKKTEESEKDSKKEETTTTSSESSSEGDAAAASEGEEPVVVAPETEADDGEKEQPTTTAESTTESSTEEAIKPEEHEKSEL